MIHCRRRVHACRRVHVRVVAWHDRRTRKGGSKQPSGTRVRQRRVTLHNRVQVSARCRVGQRQSNEPQQSPQHGGGMGTITVVGHGACLAFLYFLVLLLLVVVVRFDGEFTLSYNNKRLSLSLCVCVCVSKGEKKGTKATM